MEVSISPITLDVTKQLSRLYPAPSSQTSSGTKDKTPKEKDRQSVLDRFFAADFIPPPHLGNKSNQLPVDAEGSESYGVKYVRYLQQFAYEQLMRFEPKAGGKDSRSLADVCAASIAAELVGFSSSKAERSQQQQQVVRERILAHTILIHACIEQQSKEGERDGKVGQRVAAEFWTSRLPSHLWRSIRTHLAQSTAAATEAATAAAADTGGVGLVQLEELEVSIELLFLFSSLAQRTGVDIGDKAEPMQRSVQRVCLAIELFAKYSRHPHRKRHHQHHQHHQRKHSRTTSSSIDGAGGGESMEVGKLQRIRLGHKSLLLLQVTWAMLLGTESDAQQRLTNNTQAAPAPASAPALASARALRNSGLARDALRQIHELVDKYPLLADDARADVERLLPFVHPFDGHLTRTAQAGRFGPIPALKQRSRLLSLALPPALQPHVPGSAAAAAYAQQQQQRSLSARMQMVESVLHASNGVAGGGMVVVAADVYLPAANGSERKAWFSRPPRAARECMDAYVGSVRMTRSEREYAEWWRRLVRERGMPLSLTLNSATGGRRGMNSDITINYDDQSSRNGSAMPQYEFCGVVEAEDLPALEKLLDNDDDPVTWPPDTDGGCAKSAEAHGRAYRALFPLLPALCKAIVLTVVNWSPAEKEFPSRQFLINVGPPQVSESTCLGIVKYPRLLQKPSRGSDGGSKDSGSSSSGNSAEERSSQSRPTSPLSGSNVKRLERAESSSSINGVVQGDDTAADQASKGSGSRDSDEPSVTAEIGARLLTQYAQWQAVGDLLMQMMLGLQANHVLQADYAAQLLMNENLIPAMFWWLGTASLDYCARLPPSVSDHSFTAEYERTRLIGPSARRRKREGGGADPAAVGCDVVSDTDEQEEEEESVARNGRQTALDGLTQCLRSLRRLTSHNGLRKGLLYKNKALYFYSRVMQVPCAPVQETAADLLRDIMPVVSRKQKQTVLEIVSQVYLHGTVGLGDTFWLADYSLDPQIEMHRHVELLRLLHFYHYEAFGVRLPRDPALFPSLVNQTVVDKTQDGERRRGKQQQHSEHAKKTGGAAAAAASEYSWLLWESDLEDTLNDVYASPSTDIEAVVG